MENVRELLYLRYNVIKDKKFIELTSDLDNVSDCSEFYYDILYNDYFNETINILSQGNNCIIDHNIFLSSVGRQRFFKIFKNLKKRIKIIEIFAPLQKYYSNLVKRNNRFYEFADTHTDGSELIKAIKKHDQSVGRADLSFRRPLRSLEIWNEHFAFTKKTPKDTSLVLQKLKGNELKKIINSIISDHKKLLDYLITKKIPVSFSINKELKPPKISRYLDINNEKEIFVVKKKWVKNDYLLNTASIIDIENYTKSDILNNLVERLFPDINAS